VGHRREVFRPRKSRAKIRQSFERELQAKEFERAAQVAISHYTTRATGLDFATAMMATSEAIAIGRELRWKRSLEEIAHMAISVAESRTENRLSDFRRQTVFDLVRKSLEKAKEEP
jgi:hypothetical protein